MFGKVRWAVWPNSTQRVIISINMGKISKLMATKCVLHLLAGIKAGVGNTIIIYVGKRLGYANRGNSWRVVGVIILILFKFNYIEETS